MCYKMLLPHETSELVEYLKIGLLGTVVITTVMCESVGNLNMMIC